MNEKTAYFLSSASWSSSKTLWQRRLYTDRRLYKVRNKDLNIKCSLVYLYIIFKIFKCYCNENYTVSSNVGVENGLKTLSFCNFSRVGVPAWG
jgi:hypothetical protein